MTTSKSIVMFVTVATLFALIEETQSKEFESKIQDASEIAANPKLLFPRIAPPAPVIPAIAPPAPKPLPGNLGINGNKWGASLLPKLEGLLGGLIGGIHLSPSARNGVGIGEKQGNGVKKGFSENTLQKPNSVTV